MQAFLQRTMEQYNRSGDGRMKKEELAVLMRDIAKGAMNLPEATPKNRSLATCMVEGISFGCCSLICRVDVLLLLLLGWKSPPVGTGMEISFSWAHLTGSYVPQVFSPQNSRWSMS